MTPNRPLPEYVYHAEVVRWVDADTVDLLVDVGFNVWIKERFRLARIDAWEVRGEERVKGLAATDEVRLLTEGTSGKVTIQSYKNKGKYGRWIAEIWVGAENVSDWLVAKGHAEYVSY